MQINAIRCVRRVDIVVALLLSIECGSCSSGHGSLADGGGDVPTASDAPFYEGGAVDLPPGSIPPDCPGGSPVIGSACDSPSRSCLPTGFTCCFCEQAINCGSTYVWACETTNPSCPTSRPSIGTPCNLADTVSCIYCVAPVANLACNGGTWVSVDTVYCAPLD